MNATVIGGLVGGLLVFLSSLLVPIISKKLNKATDAAENAEKSSNSAEKLSSSALRLVERLEKDCRRCDDRLVLTKTALETLIQVTYQILPHLPDDHDVSDLITTLETAKRVLWD